MMLFDSIHTQKNIARNLALTTTIVFAALKSASLQAKESEVRCTYITEEGDTLSEVLFRSGIDGRNTQYYLYGPQGWVPKNEARNKHISDWSQLKPGEKLRLYLPASVGHCPTKIEATEPAAPTATENQSIAIDVEADPDTEKTEPNNQVNVVPDDQRLAEELQKAEIDDFNLHQVKAFFEGVKDFAMSRIEVSNYRSLAGTGLIILPKLAPWEIMVETRTSHIERVRIYAEILPKVSESFGGESFHLQSTRVQVGKGFGFSLPWDIDAEISPKLGYWKYSARMPMLVGSNTIRAANLEFDRQLDAGFDANISHSFELFSARLTHGRDLTLGLKGSSNNTARGKAYRTNLEFIVPGPTINLSGVRSRTTFSLKIMNEANKISKGDAANASELANLLTSFDIKDTSSDNEISSSVNYIGLGIGVIW